MGAGRPIHVLHAVVRPEIILHQSPGHAGIGGFPADRATPIPTHRRCASAKWSVVGVSDEGPGYRIRQSPRLCQINRRLLILRARSVAEDPADSYDEFGPNSTRKRYLFLMGGAGNVLDAHGR